MLLCSLKPDSTHPFTRKLLMLCCGSIMQPLQAWHVGYFIRKMQFSATDAFCTVIASQQQITVRGNFQCTSPKKFCSHGLCSFKPDLKFRRRFDPVAYSGCSSLFHH